MKFLEAMSKLKAFFDLFKRSRSDSPSDGNSSGKGRRTALIVSLVLSGIVILVGAALLIRKLKQRRLEKEAKEALDSYYSTDFDADEYPEDDEEDNSIS